MKSQSGGSPSKANAPRPRGDGHQRDDQRGDGGQPPHPVAHHEPPVDEQGGARREREDREVHGEERAHVVGLLEDLLGGAQVRDERSEHEPRRERVAEGGPDPHDLDHGPADGRGRERTAPLGRQRLRLAYREPYEGDHGDREEGGEDRAPPREPRDPLSEHRRDRRHQDEHRKHHRHDAAHADAFVLVANERRGHDAGSRNAHALEDAPDDHRLERGREDADHAPGHEQGEARVDGRLAPDAVGEGAEEDLADPDSEEHGGDDELDVVRMRGSEVASDHRESGQHRVGRERDERHEKGGEGNELPTSKRRRLVLRQRGTHRIGGSVPTLGLPGNTHNATASEAGAVMAIDTGERAHLERRGKRLPRDRPRLLRCGCSPDSCRRRCSAISSRGASAPSSRAIAPRPRAVPAGRRHPGFHIHGPPAGRHGTIGGNEPSRTNSEFRHGKVLGDRSAAIE